jgi:hypothetical protein
MIGVYIKDLPFFVSFLPKLFSVHQPLLPLLDEKTRAELDAFFSEPDQYKSVYALRWRK